LSVSFTLPDVPGFSSATSPTLVFSLAFAPASLIGVRPTIIS